MLKKIFENSFTFDTFKLFLPKNDFAVEGAIRQKK